MFASFLDAGDNNEKRLFNSINNLSFNGPETPNVLMDIKDNFQNLDETMKIFLRFRPLFENQIERPFEILNNCTITANAPEQSANYKNIFHGYGKSYQKFTFSNVFPETASQESIFNEVSKNILDEFIRGSDRLLFTYGTTSSGKTYTMNGNRKAIGLIPRSLNYLFKSVKLSNNPSVMPIDYCEVSSIKKADIAKILKEKSYLLKLSEKEPSELLSLIENVNDENMLGIEPSINNSNNPYETTFWISYTEIYNEFIYDLLDPSAISTVANGNNNNYNKLKRPILDIRTARNGGSYVRGLKFYPVYSAEEAYRLLLVGRKSQSMGATKLNQNSSRSHTILTIRAVRMMPGSEYLSKVGNLSFCDLAGSERTDKAQTSGVSQKEAANINSSLLALGRCIDILKYNQSNPSSQRVVPYRDSKLTRLFQTYLGGNGKASMIVCMNQSPHLFDESLQVLKFSALARKVVLHEKEIKEPKISLSKERLSLYRRLAMRTPNKEAENIGSLISDDDLECTLENVTSEEEFEEEYDVKELLDIIERLKSELIATRKEKVANEARLRETINDEWSKTIMDMERDNARKVQSLRNQMQEDLRKYARKERTKAFRELKKRKLQPEMEDYYSSSEESSEEIIRQLKSESESKDQEISNLQAQLKDAQEELRDSLERAETLEKEYERIQVHCRELEFQLAYNKNVTNDSNKLIGVNNLENSYEFSVGENSIIEESTLGGFSPLTAKNKIGLNSKSGRNAAFNRFSKFSSNPESSLPIVNNSDSSNKNIENKQSFFDPISKPVEVVEYNSTNEETSSNKIIANHGNLFSIYVDNKSDQDISFVNVEKDCAIEELEFQKIELEKDLYDKINIIKDQTRQLEVLQSTIDKITEKLVIREKCVTKMSDKENNTHRRLNNILGQLNINMDDEDLRIKDKLKLVTNKLQTMKIWFDQINEAANVGGNDVLQSSANTLLRVEDETNYIAVYIKNLQKDFEMIHNDYQQLISICNDWIIDKARTHLNLKIKRITSDTSLQDMTSRFKMLWNTAVETVSNLSSQIETINLSPTVPDSDIPDSRDTQPELSQEKVRSGGKKSKDSKGKRSKKNKSQ